MENSHWLLFFFLKTNLYFTNYRYMPSGHTCQIRALYSPIYLVSKYKMQCKYTLCMYRTARKQDSDIMFVYCQYKHSEMQLSCQLSRQYFSKSAARPGRCFVLILVTLNLL